LTELQNRGVKDIFIACVDDLKGFARAIEAVYPKTGVLLFIVHMVRASLNYVSWKERRLVAQDLKLICRAASLEEAERQLADFAQQWDKRYPSISTLWRRNWRGVIPLSLCSAGTKSTKKPVPQGARDVVLCPMFSVSLRVSFCEN